MVGSAWRRPPYGVSPLMTEAVIASPSRASTNRARCPTFVVATITL